MNRVARVFVRDQVSVHNLLDCGVDAQTIHCAVDAAFLWPHDALPKPVAAVRGADRTVGMCFRVWPMGDTEAVQDTIAKARELCRFLVDRGCRPRFISTCQGAPGYVDDSQLARQIVAGLDPQVRARCEVILSRFGTEDLIARYAECHAVIGMRLHGCILAMLAGTPAMALGYEAKSAQIYEQLGLSAYQTDFRGDGSEWMAHAAAFLDALEDIRNELPATLHRMRERATATFDEIERIVDGHSTSESLASPHSDDARHHRSRIDRFVEQSNEHMQWNRRVPLVRRDIVSSVGEGESLILIDDGQLGSDIAPHRNVSPFVERDGLYWGPPADGQAAVGELERLWRLGFRYVVLCWPAFWWLNEYAELANHLSGRRRALANDNVIVFDLNEPV